MRVTVEQESCVGAGQCVSSTAEVFDQDDDGVVVLLAGQPPAELHDAVLQAVALCPARAIRAEDGAP